MSPRTPCDSDGGSTKKRSPIGARNIGVAQRVGAHTSTGLAGSMRVVGGKHGCQIYRKGRIQRLNIDDGYHTISRAPLPPTVKNS